MQRYPRAKWLGNGGIDGDSQGWGPLPDTGRGASIEQIRLVFHTTESNTLPDYNGGKFAPHNSYDAATRRWFGHVEHDRRTGTLRGRSRTGVLGNEFSVQVEIVAYSDRKLAAERGGIWVGDFTDEHYADLAAYVAWCRENLFVPHLKLDEAYGPSKDFDSFLYGNADRNEMSKDEWLAAGGILTAHGAGPGQLHWDTGVLDLHRIVAESKGKIVAPAQRKLTPVEVQQRMLWDAGFVGPPHTLKTYRLLEDWADGYPGPETARAQAA